jgi:uncharacterized protein (TIGR02145 family)
MRRISVVFLGLIILPVAMPVLAAVCGDSNGDGKVNVGDAVHLINYIFKGGSAPNCLETGIVTDIDGNTYGTIRIGDQWWMSENLKVTHYRNDDAIPLETDSGTWFGLTAGAYCEYGNDANNVAVFGRLYNWYAVNDSRNIAPLGWHVPTDAEWLTMINTLGGEAIAGGKTKETGTAHWRTPNTGATNESGFTALPGGFRYVAEGYSGLGFNAIFWTSTENNYSSAWYRYLYYNTSIAYHDAIGKSNGLSIRCVKD